MRRAVLACAIAVGLAIGVASPTSAIGLTQVTLSCDDGTTSTMVVDTDTLTGLIQSVQAMIDYPAGLTCAIAQVPVPGIVRIGGIALASPGNNPFIVGGGRWQVPCDAINSGGGGGGAPTTGGAAPQPSPDLIWVNVAVNFHQRDDGSFFGTLNETIPANQSCPNFGPVGESHFTSKPEPSPPGCFGIDATQPNTAHVVSNVTQVSGQQPFPSGFALGFLSVGDLIHFSFTDNGNPGHQPPGVDDMLQGPPAPNFSVCAQDPNTKIVTATGDAPAFHLVHGNITLHP
jgi:hypothetical protein